MPTLDRKKKLRKIFMILKDNFLYRCLLMNATKVFSNNIYSKAQYEQKIVPYFLETIYQNVQISV